LAGNGAEKPPLTAEHPRQTPLISEGRYRLEEVAYRSGTGGAAALPVRLLYLLAARRGKPLGRRHFDREGVPTSYLTRVVRLVFPIAARGESGARR